MSNTMHGHGGDKKRSLTYNSWLNMRNRCLNPNHKFYKYYGAIGITFDPRWESFRNFLDDMGERPEGKELDRAGKTGNYTKDNCRWITHEENTQNSKRATVTAQQVILIKALLRSVKAGTKKRKAYDLISNLFAVSSEVIYHIAVGNTWRNIP